jgi:hypothetical protein
MPPTTYPTTAIVPRAAYALIYSGSVSASPERSRADAAGDRGQPGARGYESVLLLAGHRVPASIEILHRVLVAGQRAQQPGGEIEQSVPLVHNCAQDRTRRASSRHRSVAHGSLTFVGSPLGFPIDEMEPRTAKQTRHRLTFRAAISTYGRKKHQANRQKEDRTPMS